MDLQEFVQQITGFAGRDHPDKITLFGWYLHVHQGREFFTAAEIRQCYDKLSYTAPRLQRDLDRLVERRPPELLKDGRGYRLHGAIRQALDGKYGETQTTVAVNRALADLPARVPRINEQVFLEEVIRCTRARAFRAATVMAWNLAFDHLLRWLLEPSRRATFNKTLPVRYPKKSPMPVIAKFDDFEELKEREVVETCNSASLINSGVYKALLRNLDRRNTAGHPSDVVIEQPNAEDTILDLINNVVLKLTL